MERFKSIRKQWKTLSNVYIDIPYSSSNMMSRKHTLYSAFFLILYYIRNDIILYKKSNKRGNTKWEEIENQVSLVKLR